MRNPASLTHPHQKLAAAATAQTGGSSPGLDLQALPLALEPCSRLGEGKRGDHLQPISRVPLLLSVPFSFCVQVTLHGILFFWDSVIFSNMSWDLRSCHRDAKDTVGGLS